MQDRSGVQLPLISLIVNDDFFKDLPEDEQGDHGQRLPSLPRNNAREQSDARIADKVAVIEDSGTQIIKLSDETRKEIREASQGVYDSIREKINPDIYNPIWKGSSSNFLPVI